MRLSLQQIQDGKKLAVELRKQADSLYNIFQRFSGQLKVGDWLDSNNVKNAELEVEAYIQKQNQITDTTRIHPANIEDLEMQLQKAEKWSAQEQTFERFLSIQTEDSFLATVLAERQSKLKQLLQRDPGEAADWLEPCLALEEAIKNTDHAKVTEYLKRMQPIFGLELLVGGFDGGLHYMPSGNTPVKFVPQKPKKEYATEEKSMEESRHTRTPEVQFAKSDNVGPRVMNRCSDAIALNDPKEKIDMRVSAKRILEGIRKTNMYPPLKNGKIHFSFTSENSSTKNVPDLLNTGTEQHDENKSAKEDEKSSMIIENHRADTVTQKTEPLKKMDISHKESETLQSSMKPAFKEQVESEAQKEGPQSAEDKTSRSGKPRVESATQKTIMQIPKEEARQPKKIELDNIPSIKEMGEADADEKKPLDIPQKEKPIFEHYTPLPQIAQKSVELINFRKNEKRFIPEGLYLLKAGTLTDADLKPLYLQFACAVDDPMMNCNYQPTELASIYAEVWDKTDQAQDVHDILMYCAYLRMLFSAAANPYWYDAKSYQEILRNNLVCAWFPRLHEAVQTLTDFLKDTQHGFDKSVLQQVQTNDSREKTLQILSEEAEEKCNARLNESSGKMNRLKELFEALFGKKSPLINAMHIIANRKIEAVAVVRNYCSPFLTENGQEDNNEIQKYISKVWMDIPSKYNVHDELKGIGRNTANQRMRGCVHICAEWLRCLSSNPGTTKLEGVERSKNVLQQCFSSVLPEIEGKMTQQNLFVAATMVCLLTTVQEMQKRLSGSYRNQENFYLDFLRTAQIELNEDGIPEIREGQTIIPGYEPWTRLLNHVRIMKAGKGLDWESVIDRITGQTSANDADLRNFGTAALIRRYLIRQNIDSQHVPVEQAEQQFLECRAITVKWENKFRAELELAANYGQMENDCRQKERLLNLMDEQHTHFGTTHNLGFYHEFLKACLNAVQKEADYLEPQYSQEFQQLKQSCNECPIFGTIEQLIHERRFSVARNYIRLVKKENITEAPRSQWLTMEKGKDDFVKFRENYGKYYSFCAGKGDRTLDAIYNRIVPPENDNNKTKRNARSMIRSWPSSGNTTIEKLKTFLECLSFQVDSVTEKTPFQFNIHLKSMGTNVSYYPYPIAAFGTQAIQDGLQIRILPGRKTVDELVREANAIGYSKSATIFLLDSALPLAERDDMAQKIKRAAPISVSILIDRVLALYLTDCEEGNLYDALLHCTLPYHYYNPYTEGDAPIPSEMFTGRTDQLKSILENGGANLIYGGRQLGKSALLRRAGELADRRSENRWAIYTDAIKNCSESASVHVVKEKLQTEGFWGKSIQIGSWEELCRAIQERMDSKKQPVDRFLLLLDEADNLLVSGSATQHTSVENLYLLQNATNGRFKFVLAGLHNVMCFSRSLKENNSVFGKLNSLNITPLNYAEASELLEKPLSYLGFRTKPEQNTLLSQILLSTNYYPGLIQFYCSRLVKSLCSPENAAQKPPYLLDENQILVLLQNHEFCDQIRNKFFITLDVGEGHHYYRILAYALANCYYEDPETAVQGYTQQDIQKQCDSVPIPAIMQLKNKSDSLEALLEEMTEMNILASLESEAGHRYIFNTTNFRYMLGNEDEVLSELIRLGGDS